MTITPVASGSSGKQAVEAILNAIPRSVTDPKSERSALYTALCNAIKEYSEPVYVDIMLSQVTNINYHYEDPRELFRAYISAIPSGVSLPFIKTVAEILELNKVADASAYIDASSILAAETIYLATSSRARTGSNPLSDITSHTCDMIRYALLSDDSHVVAAIVKERRPASMEELRAIHAEYRGVEAALQNGVL